jgi:hypothetical protein
MSGVSDGGVEEPRRTHSGLLLWAVIVYVVAGTRRAAPLDDQTPLDDKTPLDDQTPLDPRRRALAWTSFALLAFILLPFPHALSRGLGLHCPYL